MLVTRIPIIFLSSTLLCPSLTRAFINSEISLKKAGSYPSLFRMETMMAKKHIQRETQIKECDNYDGDKNRNNNNNKNSTHTRNGPTSTAVAVAACISLASIVEAASNAVAIAAPVSSIVMPKQLTTSFDPNSFVPVCAASDTLYRALQGTTQAVVGKENFIEYGPLIASGLLRVRLELCVVESFFNEAVGPFIQQNGLSWVLPVHETVETFLAGSVFALATTFILVGSTKILTIIFTYTDFFVGAPLRIFGGFFFDRARGKPVTLDVGFGPLKKRVIGPSEVDMGNNSGSSKSNKYDYSVDFSNTKPIELPAIILSGGFKATGQSIELLREILDAIDFFVGKSLILYATGYLLIKFIHFKIFPDFP